MQNLLQNQERKFTEILFQGRNKDYGAYIIRTEYGNTMMKAMFAGVALFAAVAISPLVINSIKTPPVIVDRIGDGHVLKPVDEIPETPPQVVKPIIPVKPIENTVKIEIPTPTRDAKKETPATKLSDTKDAKIGTETIVGTPPVTNYTPPVEQHVPTQVPVVETPKPVDNSPVLKVDVSADFMGGINSFRSKVVNNFDTSIMEGTGDVVKTTVIFIVEKDGTISDVKANGPNATFNKEAEKTIRSVKGKWIPAKLNGENVRSYFKFPISMQFE